MNRNMDMFARPMHRSLKIGDILTFSEALQTRRHNRTRYVVLAFPGRYDYASHCVIVRELSTGRVFPVAQHWTRTVNGESLD